MINEFTALFFIVVPVVLLAASVTQINFEEFSVNNLNKLNEKVHSYSAEIDQTNSSVFREKNDLDKEINIALNNCLHAKKLFLNRPFALTDKMEMERLIKENKSGKKAEN